MTSPGSSPSPRPGEPAGQRLLLALGGAEERLQIGLARCAAPDAAKGVTAGHEPAPPAVLPLFFQEWVVPGRAMQFLAPLLADALARCAVRPEDLDGVACVRGPGSFTGLRLVLATALGLALSAGAPMAGLDHMALLARNARRLGPPPAPGARLYVCTHSRRNQVYLQPFDFAPRRPAPLAGPRAANLEEAAAEMENAQAAPAVFVLGTGLRRNAVFFRERLAGVVRLDGALETPGCAALLEAAAEAAYSDEPVEPLYLRPSDAEENLAAIAANRGLDPQDARRRLRDLLHG
ncbi:MAG: tRNA (adenosine(37)-N6)-threonylcarbamoyltransferase complex dimerization subunit type 1 TsaB [Desulfovibrionaceae bacterium]|jgi:tRNA threonylcarbamoyl adenosine modification protein YeaZ|nr:tRNA (adenosine(37)-N6)-threonylcarbamoyltransferase complex dimerization subunit type 1 TsaB [Desulfovibrionaceae bacterium]